MKCPVSLGVMSQNKLDVNIYYSYVENCFSYLQIEVKIRCEVNNPVHVQ